MKYSEIKQQIIDANNIIGKRFFDKRYNQFYIIEKREKFQFELNYEKRGLIKEAVSFIMYHIEKNQHVCEKF